MVKIEDREAIANLEAALYAAGRPLIMDELVRASGTGSKMRTATLLTELIRRTKKALHAIEIATLSDGSYVLQLKPQYAGTVRRFASKPLLPQATLRTLSYIAYMQPVSSRQMVETRGTGVYAHIRDLEHMDFIRGEKAGRLKVYTTTKKLAKYFGIQDNPDDIRSLLLGKMTRKAN